MVYALMFFVALFALWPKGTRKWTTLTPDVVGVLVLIGLVMSAIGFIIQLFQTGSVGVGPYNP